jgi:hypothetical protein
MGELGRCRAQSLKLKVRVGKSIKARLDGDGRVDNGRRVVQEICAEETPMTREEWYSLPTELRIQWWIETKFDKLPPSQELMAKVREFLCPKEIIQ